MEERRPLIATYITTSRQFGVLYIGMTSNLYKRMHQHRTGKFEGFTHRYGCDLLVWYRPFEFVVSAIREEKRLKRWNRAWKMQLIEQANPNWVDLYPFLMGETPDPRIKTEDDDDRSVAAFMAKLERGDTRG